jgi:hypothetical protein
VDPGLIVGLIVIAAVLWLVFKAKPAAVFIIQVRDGTAIATSGKVTEAFLQEITQQCTSAGIGSGEIRGVAWGTQIRLSFGKEFPRDLQQRLRNWWVINGWSGGPIGPRPGGRSAARKA